MTAEGITDILGADMIKDEKGYKSCNHLMHVHICNLQEQDFHPLSIAIFSQVTYFNTEQVACPFKKE
jgi:hypothetical protein